MAFNGRPAPNVSAFMANLNRIPSPEDIASQGQENFSLDDDLAMFTNTNFFDYDLGQNADLEAANFDFHGQSRQAPAAGNSDSKGIDFIQGDFTFPDFNSFPPSDVFATDRLATVTSHTHPSQPMYAASSAASPQSGLVSPQSGEKRKADDIADAPFTPGFEDASRVAAEEDKRRRNTAASARFRVKKKQREQALEKSAKEMSDKVSALEGRINQLETENKWLKNLIMEKNENKDDIAALWKKFNQETSERKGSERKDGVGTAKA